MLFTEIPRPRDCLLVFVHIPKTAGTSVRIFLRSFFEPSECCETYADEMASLPPDRRQQIRFLAGHVGWGIHDQFERTPLYITVVRDPVDRYVSLYKELCLNSPHPLYAHSRGQSVDEFLNFLLKGKSNQLQNLQCRLVCGHADAGAAIEHIRDRFYLACTIEQVQEFCVLLGAAYGKPASAVPQLNIREGTAETLGLSEESRARILETDAHDLALYRFVGEHFEEFARGYRGRQ